MSTRPEDVAIRLSPQGLEDVSRAFKQVLGDINRAGREGQKSFGPLRAIAKDLKSLLPTIGIAGAVTGLIALTKSSLQAADAAGKTAASFGTTTETLTTLQFAAKGAGIENSQLEASLTQLTKSLGELQAENKNIVDAFARLKLAVDDFRGRDVGESFMIVAERLAAIPDSAVKTRTALDIFGKQAVKLIPLMNDLGKKGFDEVRKEAERFGLVVDSQMAAAAAAVNDSFSLMGAQVRGLATQFISGLAPTVATIMEDFREDVAGTGVTAAQDFGKKVGDVIRDVIFFFQFSGRLIGKWAADFVAAVKSIAEQSKAIVTLNFDELVRNEKRYQAGILARKKAFEEDISDLIDKRIASEQRANELASRAVERSEEQKRLIAQLQALEAQQALEEKRRKEKEAADKEAQKRAEQLADAEQKAREIRLETEQKILELQGRSVEAKRLALEEEIRQQEITLAAAGQLTDEIQAQLDKLRELGMIKINLEGIGEAAEREFQTFEQAREQIRTDAELGLISQFEAERRIIDLERSRLPILQQLSAEMQKQAAALGSPQALAAADQFRVKVDEISKSLASATNINQQFVTGGLDAFQSGIEDVLMNLEEFDSVGDIFKSLGSTVANTLRQMAAEMLAAAIRAQALKLILGAFGGGASAGGGAAIGASTGGLVLGPGTGTSDSIPARLSNREFVVRRKAVDAPGVLPFLAYLNRHARLPRARGYAEGGLVTPSGNQPQAGSQPGAGGVRIINVLDPNLVSDAIGSPSGERAILNTIQRNASGIRRLIGGG